VKQKHKQAHYLNSNNNGDNNVDELLTGYLNLSAKAPQIRQGVIIANVNWKKQNKYSGTSGAS